MKTIFDHIEHVKGKPHHIRKRVAFSAAAVATGLVALVWLGGSLASGAFALAGNPHGEQKPAVAASANDANSNLAGAAAALPPSSASVPAHIEIVDTGSSAQAEKKAEPTIIPF